MSSLLHHPSLSFQAIYGLMMSGKPKEKLDMILEPLQAMIQIALLSITPVGTKLQIQENILYIQIPTFLQPVSRWYHADKKDDLYFLYSVIKRFRKWYNPQTNKNSPVSMELYQLIIRMAVEGLNQLFKTYSSSDSNTIIHVIQMYKNLLEYDSDKIMTEEILVDQEKGKINIDEVFEGIVQLYDSNVLHIVYYTLLLIQSETDPVYVQEEVDGLMRVLSKTNHRIKDWIKMNLVL